MEALIPSFITAVMMGGRMSGHDAVMSPSSMISVELLFCEKRNVTAKEEK